MVEIILKTGAVMIIELLLAFVFVLIRGLSFKDLVKVVLINSVLNLLVFFGYAIVSSMFVITTARLILAGLKLVILLIEALIYKKVISDIGHGAFIVSGVLNVGSYLAFILFLASLIG